MENEKQKTENDYCINLPSEFDLSASAWAANALVRSNNIS